MAAASIPVPARRATSALVRHIEALIASFRFALAVKHRCESLEATGRRLDGDAIRQIVRELEPTLTEV